MQYSNLSVFLCVLQVGSFLCVCITTQQWSYLEQYGSDCNAIWNVVLVAW